MITNNKEELNEIIKILKLNINTPLYVDYSKMGKVDILSRVIKMLEEIEGEEL